MRQQWFTHVRLLIAHPPRSRDVNRRSPPRLLTDAACGGLDPPPRQPRRTYLSLTAPIVPTIFYIIITSLQDVGARNPDRG